MYYFVYHVNSIALYRQEKSTLFINENKRIDNPRTKIVKYFGALKMKTCVESLPKQTMGIVFQCKKFSVFELVLTDRMYTAKIGL